MNKKFFFAVFALVMGFASIAQAQRGAYQRYNRGGGACNNNSVYYNNPNHCNDVYYNNAGACNNNVVYYDNCRRDRWGNRYGQRRVYRRPANFCQPAPVVVYQQTPVYCPPRPRVFVGRPRVNINIGF